MNRKGRSSSWSGAAAAARRIVSSSRSSGAGSVRRPIDRRRKRTSRPAASTSPATIHPLLEVQALGADRGVVAVTGHHDRRRIELREDASVDALDDLLEGAAGELGGAWSAREQRVAAEEHRGA